MRQAKQGLQRSSRPVCMASLQCCTLKPPAQSDEALTLLYLQEARSFRIKEPGQHDPTVSGLHWVKVAVKWRIRLNKAPEMPCMVCITLPLFLHTLHVIAGDSILTSCVPSPARVTMSVLMLAPFSLICCMLCCSQKKQGKGVQTPKVLDKIEQGIQQKPPSPRLVCHSGGFIRHYCLCQRGQPGYLWLSRSEQAMQPCASLQVGSHYITYVHSLAQHQNML